MPDLLKRLRDAGNDYTIAWGSGDLYDEAADEIETLQAEVARLTRGQKMLGECIHNMVVAQQSAWIEWRHGKGAEAAMTWIHNGLVGPGHIPEEDAPYGKEAQAWYDANCANPMPQCFCGRPSNRLWMGKGFCGAAHYREAKAAHDAGTPGTPGGSGGAGNAAAAASPPPHQEPGEEPK